MRKLALQIFGLMLAAIGGQGLILLVISHNPGALRHVPGGFPIQAFIYLAVLVIGLRVARSNRIPPEPEEREPGHTPRHP